MSDEIQFPPYNKQYATHTNSRVTAIVGPVWQIRRTVKTAMRFQEELTESASHAPKQRDSFTYSLVSILAVLYRA